MRSGIEGLVWVAVLAVVMITGMAKAESAGADGKPDLRPVDTVAMQLLSPPITLKLTDTNVASALNWAEKLSGTKLPIVVWPEQARKKVSLAITDAPLAQVLRCIEEKTGSVHRFRGGQIHLLMPEEVASFEEGENPKPAAEEVEKEGEPAAGRDTAATDEAKLLTSKIPLGLVNVPLVEALGVLSTLTHIPTEADESVAQKPVTVKLEDATIGEALKQIKERTGGEHRVVDGVIRIASLEKWKAIDASTAKFEKAKLDNSGTEEEAIRKVAETWAKANGKDDWGEIIKVRDRGDHWLVEFKRKLGSGSPAERQAGLFIDKNTGKVQEALGE